MIMGRMAHRVPSLACTLLTHAPRMLKATLFLTRHAICRPLENYNGVTREDGLTLSTLFNPGPERVFASQTDPLSPYYRGSNIWGVTGTSLLATCQPASTAQAAACSTFAGAGCAGNAQGRPQLAWTMTLHMFVNDGTQFMGGASNGVDVGTAASPPPNAPLPPRPPRPSPSPPRRRPPPPPKQ